MPATTTMTRAAASRSCSREQAMESGDADVVQPIDDVPHRLGGDARLLPRRKIRGAGRGDEHRALARRESPALSVMARAVS